MPPLLAHILSLHANLHTKACKHEVSVDGGVAQVRREVGVLGVVGCSSRCGKIHQLKKGLTATTATTAVTTTNS
jgi:hypothetical protein